MHHGIQEKISIVSSPRELLISVHSCSFMIHDHMHAVSRDLKVSLEAYILNAVATLNFAVCLLSVSPTQNFAIIDKDEQQL